VKSKTDNRRGGAHIVLFLAIGFLLIGIAQAQTFNVIHNFTGGQDGGNPHAGLTIDRGGNLYGTDVNGGIQNCGFGYGCGTVFQLRHAGSNWVFNLLYSFTDRMDGGYPDARVVFGPDGSLYGTTPILPHFGEYGAVFNLKPPPTICKTTRCSWTETTLHTFSSLDQGGNPAAEVVFDQAGNLYSTTLFGGLGIGPFMLGYGVVFELTPSGGSWTYSVLYKFTTGAGGSGGGPTAGVIFDNAGNLYGPDASGGDHERGMIYELTPSGPDWTEKTLYTFPGEQGEDAPAGGLIFDSTGNLYGTTANGGTGGGGTVFELIPTNGNWTLNTLYSFSGSAGCGPEASLVMDGAGNLYGTTYCDGANGFGSVFKLTPTPTPPWTYTSLHDFRGGSDGAMPMSNVVIDSSGNLYGTAVGGGSIINNPHCAVGLGYHCGVVWEITP
jgi:uncharacterized repeat protein (TIGR03803 family)